jgi:hypothetical protein
MQRCTVYLYLETSLHVSGGTSTHHLIQYQKGANYMEIKIFNHLPTHINCVANEMQLFKLALKEVSSF